MFRAASNEGKGQKIDINYSEWMYSTYDNYPCRHDICHKHHKQRLCKIISTRVKFHFLNRLWNSLCMYNFVVWQYLLILTNDKV